MGAGTMGPRSFLIPWLIWPIPATIYFLGVWWLYLERFGSKLKVTGRITALGVLLSSQPVISPDLPTTKRLFLDGMEQKLTVPIRNELRQLLSTIAVDTTYKDIKQTAFITPDPKLKALLDRLYPGIGKVVVVTPIVEGINPVKVSWGGHDIMWGIFFGPEIIMPLEARDLSGNLAIFKRY